MQPTSIGDGQARARALDVGRSFIVRAPAGSGKTRLLIQRYLALLARVDEPEEIVAITFTRKAAAEMRERVLHALAHARQPQGDLDEVTRAHALAALERDVRCEWQLAANASRLRILTIDALNATITRQMPLAARFGAQPENIEDATPLYREAARALLAEVNGSGPIADDVAVLLEHLDNDLATAESLLAVMLRSRDHWLRSLGRMNEREALEAALQRVRADAMREVAARFPNAEKQETLELARFSWQNRPESLASTGVSSLLAGHVWLDVDEACMPAWIGLAELLLTASGTWRKRGGVNKNLGFPSGEDKEEKAFFAPWKARMGELLDRLAAGAQADELATALHRLRDLPADRYSEPQWQVLGAILRLLPVATAMLWTVFGERGQCDFVEVAQSASRALGEDDAPTDLAIALDHRIRHLLIDEFQDTSFAQFALLERLTRGWSPGDGRSFFAVGDPMQSIYRFREAEVALFLRAMRHGIGEVMLEPLELSVNFRCSAGVVEWVNQTFGALMPQTEDVDAGRVPYVASIAASGPADVTPAVTWHPQLVRAGQLVAPEAIEADTVVRIIRATRDQNPSASMALLVRNRSHLLHIVPALKAAGITFRAVDIDPLGERPVVQDLLALARALLHPADR
ncbi:MAG TPA: UvrD-helicase domain-containing protein, partial [Usitatibacteraceae bacterium]|nr:UvrD-helicase domain-containing protein [Usitatibacteraceae bacterium]